jgi:drug/metabolite transporter (DMT)-like permease
MWEGPIGRDLWPTLQTRGWLISLLKTSSQVSAPSRSRIILAFAAVYIIWGSTYLGILLAIQSIPPMLMAGIRYGTAGCILYVITRWRGVASPPASTWKPAVIIGACLLLCGNGGVTISEKFIDSGLAAVMVATVPIYVTLLGWLTGSAPRPTPLIWVGLLGGFAGVVLLLGQPAVVTANHHPRLGMGILLCTSLVWSAGSLYSRAARTSVPPFMAASQQMICGGALLIIAGLFAGEARVFDPYKISFVSLMAFIYLVLIGAIVGFTAYIWLLQHCDPRKVATYAYVNPVVALILGTLFAHEKLSGKSIAGATLIVGSVAVVITAQQFRSRKIVPAGMEFAEAEELR